MTYLPYSTHPLTISEQIQAQHYNNNNNIDNNNEDNNKYTISNQKHKKKSYGWIKMFAISLNLIYMLRSLEGIYIYGSIATKEQHNYYKATSASFDLLLSSIILFTLVIDIIIITTKKLSIANSIWRPGVFFFSFLLGQKVIQLMNKVMNHEYFFNLCQQNLGDNLISNHLITMICEQQLEIDQISSFLFLCRDIFACSIYVIALHYYMPYLIQKLKKNQQRDTVNLNSVHTGEENH